MAQRRPHGEAGQARFAVERTVCTEGWSRYRPLGGLPASAFVLAG
jgi:hypothetical protein